MKIVIDKNMLGALPLFETLGEVTLIPGRELKAEDLIDVDALMVRSITKVDAQLLCQANRLAFVGTATAGFDHIDRDFLNKNNIEFAFAPGCNKVGVAEYVISALLVLSEESDFCLNKKTVGIVGVGQVGSYLAKMLQAMEINTLLCDPIRAKENCLEQFCSLDEIIKKSDVISLHTPLTYQGDYPTYRLFDYVNNLGDRAYGYGTVINDTIKIVLKFTIYI